MPNRPYLYARQREQATDEEIQNEFIRAQQALVDQMDERPDINNRDQMKAWFMENCACWDYYYRLFKDLERRWRKKAAPNITPEEAEKAWQYWNELSRKGEIIR